MNSEQKKSQKKENPWINLAFNIVIPALILSKLSSEARLGPFWGFIIALAFPTVYGLYDFIKNRKSNLVSILGFVSILLTGGLGLLKVDGIWFAVKEAAIPAVIGIAVIGSLKTKKPLIKSLLFNENIINVPLVNEALQTKNNQQDFDRLLIVTTWLFSASFFLSAILNFALAQYLLKSPAGTEDFNIELGKMTALSYPVIVLPCMIITGFAMYKLMSGIKLLTGLEFEQVFKGQHK
ncbi:MAG: VC0807 family protein [Bdellovibrionota bacterium]